MSFTRESDSKDKDAFFDHGLNYFKKRLAKPEGDPAAEGDLYGHIDSGKDMDTAAGTRDYTTMNDAVEDPSAIHRGPRSQKKDDPMAPVYAMLREHGGVIFGAQLEDGSWELTPGSSTVANVLKPTPEGKRSNWQETLSPESQIELAAALEKFAPKG